jgi:hypothetical protein
LEVALRGGVANANLDRGAIFGRVDAVVIYHPPSLSQLGRSLAQLGTRRLDLSGVTRLHPAAERLLDAIVDSDGPRLS